ncbi:tRNA1(Val) (adenine(37)-N6)-methyltransferase [Mycoplasmopsis gallinarum]|uniref:Putative O-methyltransferase n=1 Tax=Mycoplasmopsis gallinarum TaxID=29557 RepID=A0A168RFX3_9BACT|nr:tRNA1(Val) (adenine(37)-N6)-methyltransferase [Mycoplasmopsis gallinarum]OAB48944.1 putative O-methyltransferase [Mycoplasmopsis gallinarum]
MKQEEIILKRNLIKNSLGFDSELFVYQDKTMFNYSVDTIMLGNFVSLNRKVKKMLEIGTNNGALSIFISERFSELKIDAIEIQSEAIEVAKINVEINNKQQQINLINDDFNLFWIKKVKDEHFKKYDSIVCNPPFYRVDKTKISKKISEQFLIATHEIKLTLEQLIYGASKIIEQKGYFTVVIPVERMIDCTFLMRKYNFEPKRIQFILPRMQDQPKLVLIEARYQAGWGTKFLPNLYLHDPNNLTEHLYRKEIKELYKPKKVITK